MSLDRPTEVGGSVIDTYSEIFVIVNTDHHKVGLPLVSVYFLWTEC